MIVASFENFANCPVHDGGTYHGLKEFKSEKEFYDYILDNLNVFHVLDTLVINSDTNIKIEYEAEGHRYCGIIVEVDGNKIMRTIDNGSGGLIWCEI